MLVATASSGTKYTLRVLAWFGYTGFEIVAKLGIPVWSSPRSNWTGEEGIYRRIKGATAGFERALAHPPASLSLEKVLYLYLIKTTAMTDPKFFAADYEYHQELPMPASWWKKSLVQLVYWVEMKRMESHLTPVKMGKFASDA